MAPLRGLRILSVGLNLPAPVAAQRARQLGARVRKIEPPGGDPVALMAASLYSELHAGVTVQRLDLGSEAGQRQLQRELARTDVLLSSFRPKAMARLGLGWRTLHRRYPRLWQVAVFGSLAAPDAAGHDLTYQAELGLVQQTLPPTLWADLCGAQAALTALHQVQIGHLRGEPGRLLKIGLQEALAEAAAPRRWGLTRPGDLLGGRHAGYQVFACRDGRVAVAALEPKFAHALADCARLSEPVNWLGRTTQQALAAWFAQRGSAELRDLALQRDLPLVVCPEE